MPNAPLLTLASLTTPLTRAEAQASIYRVLAQIGVSTTSWKSGAVVRTMIVGVAAMCAALSGLIAQVARLGFLGLSEGEWLDLVAWHVYGIRRIQATFATGEAVFVNGGAGVYSLAAGDAIVTNPVTGASYRTTAPLELAAGATSAPIPIIAIEAGSGGTSAAGAITAITTTLPGVSVSNAARMVGVDCETDAQLIARCGERLGALSPFGPWDAYSYAAKNAARASDGSPIGVTRVRLEKDGYGHVDLYVARPSGIVEGSAEDPSTDLGAVALAVQRNAEAQAVTSRVHSAALRAVAVSCTCYTYNTSGRTAAQVSELVSAALDAFFDAQPVGGVVVDPDVSPDGALYADAMRSAIASALPQIVHVTLDAPSGEALPLAVNEVPVRGAFACTVRFVAPPEGYTL